MTTRNRSPYSALLTLLLACIISGCSIIKSIGNDRDNLRNKIRSGMMVKTDDRVRVTTVNGAVVVLTVTSLNDDTLSGNEAQYIPDKVVWGGQESTVSSPAPETVVAIPIDDIVSLVDEDVFAQKKPSEAGNALMLAVYGFLIMASWAFF